MKKITIRSIIYCFLFLGINACSKKQYPVQQATPPTTTPGELTVYPSPGLGLSTVEHLSQSNDYTVEVRKTGEIEYKTSFVYKTDNDWVHIYFGSVPKSQTAASFTSDITFRN